MIDFTAKKCLCNITDCGKCLSIGCTDDGCNVHKMITKWRYRKNLLESLLNKVNKLQESKKNNKEQIIFLQSDVECCKKEVKRLADRLQMAK